jgi:hypothetical protein
VKGIISKFHEKTKENDRNVVGEADKNSSDSAKQREENCAQHSTALSVMLKSLFPSFHYSIKFNVKSFNLAILNVREYVDFKTYEIISSTAVLLFSFIAFASKVHTFVCSSRKVFFPSKYLKLYV